MAICQVSLVSPRYSASVGPASLGLRWVRVELRSDLCRSEGSSDVGHPHPLPGFSEGLTPGAHNSGFDDRERLDTSVNGIDPCPVLTLQRSNTFHVEEHHHSQGEDLGSDDTVNGVIPGASGSLAAVNDRSPVVELPHPPLPPGS